ncbi:PspC domain-containing protein [Paenibacillus lemnae]|uniref:PspC domain-containing protein n=1 Tax=Paenibacillus lemnae TaxID=1330551 RepID=A0A848M5T0_PAELE|nr:PspC domain-containing protein [Paenibacillus lemnae]NMO95581.1 PspC domain-containing protein [Paenibacillus lemnae]
MTKLFRSTRDKAFTGLIGGLSDTLGVDSTLIRIIFVVSIFFTGGATLLIYLIAALVVPKEPNYRDPYRRGGRRPEDYRYDYDPRGPHQGYPEGRRDFQGEYDGYDRSYRAPGFDERGPSPRQSAPEADLDAMMKDIEKKALKKEIDELKQKLSKYEKGDL